MMNVIIVKGAHTGRRGIAHPSRAIGPTNNRTFLVLVHFDNGDCIEFPLDAINVI